MLFHCLGKKAYLFCETSDVCCYAVEMYSLFGTCKVLGKNPKELIVYVLDYIKDTKSQDMHSIQQSEWVEC